MIAKLIFWDAIFFCIEGRFYLANYYFYFHFVPHTSSGSKPPNKHKYSTFSMPSLPTQIRTLADLT